MSDLISQLTLDLHLLCCELSQIPSMSMVLLTLSVVARITPAPKNGEARQDVRSNMSSVCVVLKLTRVAFVNSIFRRTCSTPTVTLKACFASLSACIVLPNLPDFVHPPPAPSLLMFFQS